MSLTAVPSRRLTSRVEARGGVWVYWGCNGRHDVSPVRDVSLGGLFISTRKSIPQAAPAEVCFLVQEGQIRAEAVVRHVEPNSGLGLKFTAVTANHQPNLAALLERLQNLGRPPGR